MGFIELVLFLIGVVFLVNALDDLVIDLVFYFSDVKHPALPSSNKTTKEKPIAIIVAAWKESDVIRHMVETNLRRIRYSNYYFFIGVYPNDAETLAIAQELQKDYPEKVVVVVTDKPGPTSKAHCLNCLLNAIEQSSYLAEKNEKGFVPRYIALHDAEDVIHPDSLSAINNEDESLDFIQVPVFSLPVKWSSWVAGTYMDEFAESHLKEIPVRGKLGMPIPSAGVGTFFSFRMLRLLGRRFGYFFDEDNLTEDYEIGMRIARLGGKQKFLLQKDDRGEIIATREFFPDSLGRSVKQKGRWVTGIGIITMLKWGLFGVKFMSLKKGDIPLLYALWRDRKALWTNPVVLVSWALVTFMVLAGNLMPMAAIASSAGLPMLSSGLSSIGNQTIVIFQYPRFFRALFTINTIFLAHRLFLRSFFTRNIYGNAQGFLAMPRLLVSSIVNASAAVRAIYFFTKTKISKDKKLIWHKTQHKYPTLEEIGDKKEEITL